VSAQDRRAEREVADFYAETVRPAPAVDRGPLWPRAKRYGENFLTGFIVAKAIRSFFD
jgi:hypothetical protein